MALLTKMATNTGRVAQLKPGAANNQFARKSDIDPIIDAVNAIETSTDVLDITSATISSTLAVTGVITPTGGVAASGGFTALPTLIHTGAAPAIATTSGSNLDIVVTELYVAEVFIPCNMTITGVAVFNGTAVAGNIKVMLYDSTGTRVAISATTAASGTTAFQRVAFSSTYSAKGPATYYVAVMGDNNGGDFRTHTVGNFRAGKITGLVYATESGYATITVPTTFTTAVGPLANLY